MGYYFGDFYMSQGGWRGDPGFLSWAGKLIGMAPIPGASALGGVLSKLGAPKTAPLTGQLTGAIERAGGIAGGTLGQMVKRGGPMIGAAAGGALLGAGGGALMHPAAAGAVPKGYHLCKGLRPGVRHPHPCKTGPFVRNRRMNVCNPRALRRSIRRCHGFAKLAMKVIHITHPKKKGRFGGFRRKRKH